MRLSDLKDIIKDSVTVCKDDGLANVELLYSGYLEDCPVRVLGYFVGNLTLSENGIYIFVYDLPFT